MADILEKSFQLGSTSENRKLLAARLVDETVQFAMTSSRHGVFPGVDEMTNGYLYDSGAGERILGRYLRLTTWPPHQWPKHQRIIKCIRQMFSIIIRHQPPKELVASPGEISSAWSQILRVPSWEIIVLGSGEDSGGAAQLMNEVYTSHTSKAKDSKLLDNVPSGIRRQDIIPNSDLPNHTMMSSNFLNSGSSGQIPLIARSKADLVKTLDLWIQNHDGRLPPGAIKGSILNVQDHLAKPLIFVGTSATILIDRLLVNKTTIGWVLRAADESCMYTRHTTIGSNIHWRGYSAWFGDEFGFTDTIMASTDGKPHKPTRPHEIATPSDASKVNKSTSLSAQPPTQFQNANAHGDFSVNPQTFHTYSSSNDKVHKDGFAASLAKGSAVKPKSEGHRYPTRNRRLASFTNEFKAWELQGNQGVQIPPISSSFMVNGYHWPPQHPGTPPPTPRKKSKRQRYPRRLQEAVPLQSGRQRSPSIEITSNHQTSPGRRGRSKLLKSNDLGREKKAGGRAPSQNFPLTPKTPSHACIATTKSSPSIPTPNSLLFPATISEPYQADKIVFHFFLSDESFGAIPKLFVQCATPKSFFNEAHSAWHVLGETSDQARLLGVKVSIEGITRPVVVIWESKDGFKRMVEAISNETVGRTQNLNVEVRCIKLG